MAVLLSPFPLYPGSMAYNLPSTLVPPMLEPASWLRLYLTAELVTIGHGSTTPGKRLCGLSYVFVPLASLVYCCGSSFHG